MEPAHRTRRGAAIGGHPLRGVYPQWRGTDQRRPAWIASCEVVGGGNAQHSSSRRAGGAGKRTATSDRSTTNECTQRNAVGPASSLKPRTVECNHLYTTGKV